MDSHVDRRRVFVTDRIGVDVRIFELGDESLCSDRFPVMLHLLAPLLPEPAGTLLEADDGVDIARPSNAGLTQCTAEVAFRDVAGYSGHKAVGPRYFFRWWRMVRGSNRPNRRHY